MPRHRDDLVKRCAKALDRLQRKTVDQIDVQRRETELASRVEDGTSLALALHAIDGKLDRRVEVLDAERHAVEAEAAQEGDGFAVDAARIDLDRKLRVVGERESRSQPFHQHRHLALLKKRGRSSPPVQLRHRGRDVEVRRDEVDLLYQPINVRRAAALVLRDHLVAAAVVTDRFAEGQVAVDRERRALRARLPRCERPEIVVGTESLAKAVRGGIRRVARTERVVLPDQALGRENGAHGARAVGLGGDHGVDDRKRRRFAA